METFIPILSHEPALSRRFEVLAVLGEGTGGAVYRVRDRQDRGREVALKILTNTEAFDENTFQRFREEVKVCQRLNHPNLVRAYAWIELASCVAFTMDYVSGSDLGAILSQEKIPLHGVESIVDQLLSGLEELHSNGILHRDLKLENILVSKDGEVKLADFGLIKNLSGQKLTQAGILLGTAQYMPPEYIRFGKYDQRGDIYAVGVVMYELLLGRRWLSEMSGHEVIEHRINNKFAPPPLDSLAVPTKHSSIIARATCPEPEGRFASAGQMRRAIHSNDGGRAIIPTEKLIRRGSYREKRETSPIMQLTIFLLILCLILLGIIIWLLLLRG